MSGPARPPHRPGRRHLHHGPLLTTGHVLLAILERYAYLSTDFIDALPSIHEVTAAVTAALPGQEDA